MVKKELFIQWDSTNDCNLRCCHCYHNNESHGDHIQDPDEIMSLEEVKKMVDDLVGTTQRWGMVPRLHISGGEPLMRKDLFEILDYSQTKEVPTRLLTNGTLITKEKANELKKRGMDRLQISIDGDRRTHNKIRQRFYAFDDAMSGIANSREAGLGVTISFTAMQSNKRFVEQAVRDSIEAGADLFGIQSYVPRPELGTGDPEFVDAKGLYKIYQLQRELGERYENRIKLLESEVLWDLMHCDDALEQKSREEGKYLGGCGAGFSGVTVLSNGRVYPCRRLPIDIGHISEGLVRLITEKEVMQKLRDFEQIRENTGCENVTHCRGCRAVAYATTGDYMAKDPMCFKDLVKPQEIIEYKK